MELDQQISDSAAALKENKRLCDDRESMTASAAQKAESRRRCKALLERISKIQSKVSTSPPTTTTTTTTTTITTTTYNYYCIYQMGDKFQLHLLPKSRLRMRRSSLYNKSFFLAS